VGSLASIRFAFVQSQQYRDRPENRYRNRASDQRSPWLPPAAMPMAIGRYLFGAQ
jgi:hypothetical protein